MMMIASISYGRNTQEPILLHEQKGIYPCLLYGSHISFWVCGLLVGSSVFGGGIFPFASRRRRERKERIIIAQTEKNTEGKREEDSAAFSRLLFLSPLTLTLAPLQEEEREEEEEEEEEGIRGQMDLPQIVGVHSANWVFPFLI